MTMIATSAPGKVILFGEHAVVHGSHAVAASVGSLRIHAELEVRRDGLIRLDLEDIGAEVECPAKELLSEAKGPPDRPREEVLERVRRFVGDDQGLSRAVLAGLYLIAELANSAVTLRVKSAGLPLGAGLGSSAAFAVATAAALCAQRGIRDRDIVNQWAFTAEVICHGTPSGLDNAVACFGGGALAVRRNGRLERTPLTLPKLALLVVDTTKPRSTSILVQNVRNLLADVEKPIRRIFDAIDAIALDFAKDSSDGRRIGEWIRLNHALLRALKVSDPTLESVVSIAESHGAPAKLTGAGGGGCAVVLLHDQTSGDRLPGKTVDNLIAKFQRRGFTSYLTDLGGDGVIVSDSPLPGSPFRQQGHQRRRVLSTVLVAVGVGCLLLLRRR